MATSRSKRDAGHVADCDLPVQSMLTPAALIGAAHFSISLLRNCPRYCGVVRSSDTTWAPAFSNASRTAGVFMACTTALLSLLTTASGAPLGRKMALQV